MGMYEVHSTPEMRRDVSQWQRLPVSGREELGILNVTLEALQWQEEVIEVVIFGYAGFSLMVEFKIEPV